MELLTSLPAELVAIADPSARGAAPLLRPADADAGSAAQPASFDACLALLAMPLPAGEAWPLTGKELPAAPLDTAAVSFGVDPDALATGAADAAALLARLRLASALPATDLPPPDAGPGLPLPDTAVPAQLPNASPASVAAEFVVDATTDESSLAEPAPPVTDVLPLDTAEAQGASPEPPELPSWLDTLAAHDERASRFAAASSDPRAPAAMSPAGAAATAAVAAQPTPEAAVVAAKGLRRDDVTKISLASGATLTEAPGIARPEWLPAGHANAASTAPAQGAAAPPVDVRSPGWQDAFANRVQWIVDSDVGEARITLHPPDLGAVDIEISFVDDKTYVQLTTATAAAHDELSQNLPRLRELFTVSGLELGGASVHDGRGGQRGGHGDGAAAASARHFAPFAELADDTLSARPSRPLGRIDVFA